MIIDRKIKAVRSWIVRHSLYILYKFVHKINILNNIVYSIATTTSKKSSAYVLRRKVISDPVLRAHFNPSVEHCVQLKAVKSLAQWGLQLDK